MSDFLLTILGSNSATPAFGRHPSAQILRHKNLSILIDCGEGTQFQMNRFGSKRSGLDIIFISHMHGDHYFGLVGLLNSMRLNGRKDALTIFGPPELKAILLLQTPFEEEDWSYPITFIAHNYGQSYLLHETKNLLFYTIPLNHRIPCNGLLIKEKQKELSIRKEAIEQYKIPYTEIPNIKKGADFVTQTGQLIPNKDVTDSRPHSFSYAYCSDTLYDESIIPIIKGADLLYHETTFAANENEKAALRYHSTTKQAAEIAKLAEVGKLIIGHYSAKYYDLEQLLEEAKSVFPNTVLAIEGQDYLIENE